ncbi:MAG: NADH-quinone oxidoreductase subunit N [Dehalococcoidia bacterium]
MTDILGNELNFNMGLLLPEIILAGAAVLVVFFDMFWEKAGRGTAPAVTLIALVAAGVFSVFAIDQTTDFARLVTIDNFTAFFRVTFIAVAIVLVLGSYEYVDRHVNHAAEFYALLLLSTVGAMFMASARDLLVAYLGIEVLSFSLYIAVSLAKNDSRAGEAGLKYVLLGGVASAMLLYGLSLLYGVAGSTQYTEIAAGLSEGAEGLQMPLLLGLTLIVAGLGFKVSAVPFHMWAPDAYEGAPMPVTAYLSATSKGATLALFLRWFGGPLLPALEQWQWMMAIIATLTMVFGNLIALQQHNIKRLLAYSSIAQGGFMLMAVTTISDIATSALLVHLGGYIITNLALFIAIIHFYNRTGKEEITDFAGLSRTNPYLAVVITSGLFSLAGMPLLAGFFTKFILFQAVVEGGFLWLVVVAVVGSTVSLFYYLQVIRQMYIYEPADATPWRVSGTGYLTTGALLALIVFVGIQGAPLYTVADRAAYALFENAPAVVHTAATEAAPAKAAGGH